MKRLLSFVVVAFVALLCADRTSAQINCGVIGGATFSTTNIKEFGNGTMTQYHAGFTMRVKLPVGFSIQPSLIYQVKGANTAVDGVAFSTKVGYLELPVSLQWGPDLILFRPFLEVTPFVGYGLNNKFFSQVVGNVCNAWEGVNRWEYGVGAGVGLDIWKFQVIARYNWNLGTFSDGMTMSDVTKTFQGGANFGGVTLSLAYLF